MGRGPTPGPYFAVSSPELKKTFIVSLGFTVTEERTELLGPYSYILQRYYTSNSALLLC